MNAVILAGGAGTRLRLNSPKVLVKIGDKPIIEHQIILLKKYGFKNIWVLSGFQNENVRNFLRAGKKWGVHISHISENEKNLLGSAGALKSLEYIYKNDFLVLSGDVMLDIDLSNFIRFHNSHNGQAATIVVHPSDHPHDSDLVQINKVNLVTKFLIRKNKTQPKNLLYSNLTNTGISIFSPKVFNLIKKNEKQDIEKDLFPKILASSEKIYAYKTAEYLKDMGTPDRLKKVISDYKRGKIVRLNRGNSRAAIFMDRDGTINFLIPDLSHIKDFKLLPGSADGISKINQSEYLAIVITNQPQLAKGMLSASQLDQIHKKLETELGNHGAKLDAIYFCPHHPESGFEGEVKNLKINCNCRKPKIGLIKKAVKDFNIDLSKSYFIGDSTTDYKTARNAKIKFIGVRSGFALKDKKYPLKKTISIPKNLLEAVDNIISFNN